jgi:dipeptidase E
MKLLLLSNSTGHGRGYLDHAWPAVESLLGGAGRLLFVPFALRDHAGYTAKVRDRFAPGRAVEALAPGAGGLAQLDRAEAVFVGGGNTFRLLATLQAAGLLAPLAERVRSGLPYLGASAGTNLATPTIRTTNDMPIVEPAGFAALGLVPFQINPHYLDPDPRSTHMGETREQRIREFHEENVTPVVGLREGSWLRVESAQCWLDGPHSARLFRPGREPVEAPPGTDLAAMAAA